MKKNTIKVNGGGALLAYYIEHGISPVKQDISDLILHYRRREKLYRMLGLPVSLFENQTILEVGSGSGYNTLAFFRWGAKVDLVEPNATGRADMQQLFSSFHIPKDSYEVHDSLVDDFTEKRSYKIIIAEGFIPGLDNQEEVIHKLIDLAADGGVIVITCVDEIGLFVEQLKRLVAHILTKDMQDFDDKINFLIAFFAPQLSSLKGMSRSAEDWVKDMILNPAVNQKLLGISEAIQFFGDQFEVLGSSQSMFVDYSWYKDLAYDYKLAYEQQYKVKRHNLMMVGLEETLLSDEDSEVLYHKINGIREYSIRCEATYDDDLVQKIIRELEDIVPIVLKADRKIYHFICETIDILRIIGKKQIDFAQFKDFSMAFGRSQQYLSLIKKVKY